MRYQHRFGAMHFRYMLSRSRKVGGGAMREESPKCLRSDAQQNRCGIQNAAAVLLRIATQALRGFFPHRPASHFATSGQHIPEMHGTEPVLVTHTTWVCRQCRASCEA